MITNVKFLKEHEEGISFSILNSPYRELICVKDLNEGVVVIKGTITLSVMSHIVKICGLLDQNSNFSEELREEITTIKTEINGTEVIVKKKDSHNPEKVYDEWKKQRIKIYQEYSKIS